MYYVGEVDGVDSIYDGQYLRREIYLVIFYGLRIVGGWLNVVVFR